MGRPPGAQNKMTREKDAAAKELAEEYGDPLEDMLVKRDRWQKIYDEQVAKPSRHRNVKKLAEAEAMIKAYNEAVMPFMRAKYANISHSGEVAQAPMVIRAPKTIPDNELWLATYGPKRDDAVNDLPFVQNLRVALDRADDLGVDDAEAILNAARNHGDKKS
jgi:hypothetical protein